MYNYLQFSREIMIFTLKKSPYTCSEYFKNFLVKVFSDFHFWTFFLSNFQKWKKVLPNYFNCDHTLKLWCDDWKNIFQFVTIFF